MKLILSLLFIISIASISCEKEEIKNNTPANPVAGTWDFISIDAQTQSSKEFKLGPVKQKLEATLNYVTENNLGGLIVTDSIITKTGLAYSIFSHIKTYNYKNDVLTDTKEKPYNISINEPPSSCNYKMIGNDSISFSNGEFLNFSVSTLTASPIAARVSINGDTLKLKEYIYKDSTETKLGVVYHNIQTGTAITTFLKHKN